MSLAALPSGPELVRVAWRRRKWLALACFSLPFAILAAIIFALPGLFRSSALLIVDPPHQQPGVPSADGSAETQLHVLTQENLTRARLEGLVERYSLYPELRRTGTLEGAADRLRRDLDVETKEADSNGGGAIAFTVSYIGRDPKTVADVANAVANYYVDESLRRRAVSARQSKALAAETVKVLTAQVAAARRELDAQEKQVGSFKAAYLHELPEQVPVNLAAIERLNTQLEADRTKQANLRTESLRSEVKAPETQLDNNTIRLIRLRDELKELRLRATDQHPDVIRLKLEIAALVAAGAGGPGSSRATAASAAAFDPERSTREELHALDQDERALQATIPTLEEKVYNAPKRQQELQSLLPSYEATKALYDSLMTRLEDATLASQLTHDPEPGAFQLVDPAVPSRNPEAPNRLKLLLIVLFLCVLLGVAASVIAEKTDTSFHSLDELRNLTTVPVLSSIPRIVTRRDAIRRNRRRVAGAIFAALALIACLGSGWAVANNNEALVWLLARHGRT